MFRTIRHLTLSRDRWIQIALYLQSTSRSYKLFLPISNPVPCTHVSFPTHSQNNFSPWIYHPNNTNITFIEWKSTKRIAFGANQPSALRLPWLRCSVIFLSCKANARVFVAKSGHGPHFPPLTPGAQWLTKTPVKRRIFPEFNTASLGSETRQPTNQRLSAHT